MKIQKQIKGFATIENTPQVKGRVGTSMQSGSVKKKKRKLSEKEKIKRGIGVAKGSNLKFTPHPKKDLEGETGNVPTSDI